MAAHGAGGAGGKCDEALIPRREIVPADLRRFAGVRLQECLAGELQQVLVAGGVLHQDHDRVRLRQTPAAVAGGLVLPAH